MTLISYVKTKLKNFIPFIHGTAKCVGSLTRDAHANVYPLPYNIVYTPWEVGP